MQLLIRFPLHSSYTSTYIATITYLSLGGGKGLWKLLNSCRQMLPNESEA